MINQIIKDRTFLEKMSPIFFVGVKKSLFYKCVVIIFIQKIMGVGVCLCASCIIESNDY